MSTTPTPTERFGQLPGLPQLPACLEFLKLKQFPLKVFPPVDKPATLTKDTLYIYGPGWRNSWASFDVDCLQMQMYLKFCDVDFDIVNSNEPHASPSGKLPFLVTVPGAVYESAKIHQWLKDTQKEKTLPSATGEQAKAFIALANSKLYAALLFSQWLEPLNYSEITSKAYYSQVPSPINWVLAYRKKTDVVQRLLTDRDILVREEIYQDAANALEALSVKLGDDTYFFGESEPTWMDAVIFSYLHVIMGAPQFTDGTFSDENKRQAGTLRGLVRKHENLVQYAKAIYEKYLK
ncbi:uncharacterized protein BYT42DRAFT_495800 [Radiomyces spectabilis]|uniref:uncharacterized protein n=1 Tax=Radiomyces spectabilis TaxID=64574 RepID=UPI00221F31E9|nr:uncharacterized protein BYT42DRAFT_495800 [Radiomyces spectabilis]KAI8379192.1 hypothetical protein BYT42DRAFT_495800 [Radiomyces spectabilis]